MTTLRAALVALPKVEQHCHVEGTLRPGTLVDLARTRSSAPERSTRSVNTSSTNKAAQSATSTSVLEAANFPVWSSVRTSRRSSARSMTPR